jgi:hypothetical protein
MHVQSHDLLGTFNELTQLHLVPGLGRSTPLCTGAGTCATSLQGAVNAVCWTTPYIPARSDGATR